MERSPAAYVNIFTGNNADGLDFPFNDNVQDTILAIKESSTGSPLTDENSVAFDLPFGGVIHHINKLGISAFNVVSPMSQNQGICCQGQVLLAIQS